MFGKFTVNSHDWCIIENYFKTICPQIVEHYLGNSQDNSKPWASSNQEILNVYSAMYNLCVAKESRNQRIYAFYQNILEQFLYLWEAKSVESTEEVSIIEREVRLWKGYSEFSRVCKKTCGYLDRYYVNDSQVESLDAKALSIYETVHLNSNKIMVIIKEMIVEFGEKRASKRCDDDSLLKLSNMFRMVSKSTGHDNYNLINLSVNSLTVRYYQKLHERLSSQLPQSHLEQIYQILEFQDIINKLVLPEQDGLQYNTHFQIEIMTKFIPTLTKHELGLKLFFKQERIQYLNRLYKLLLRFNCIEPLKTFYYNYVRSLGFELFQAIGKEEQIEVILERFSGFYLHTLDITNQIFESSPVFQIEFRKVMEIIIHLHDEELNIAWKLVEAIHHHFASNPSDKSLQPVLIMFDCLTSKDIFIESYEADLTDRLLSNNCPYLKEEIQFIQGIKQKCGDSFTELIELKIKDYISALELNQLFYQQSLGIPKQVKFSIKVLSKKYWTLENKPNKDYFPFSLVWPQSLLAIKDQFQRFYTSKNQNKHIQHLPLLSTTLISVKYRGQNQEILSHQMNTNLLQSAIIIFIEQSNVEVPYAEILKQFGISEEVFSAQIKTFTIGVSPLLLKGEIGYKLNDMFNPLDNGLNVQIPNLRKNSKAEASNIDRQLAIQAAIVKILKLRGKVGFDELIQEVEVKLKFFKPVLSKIKEGLQKLIERDYIERSVDEVNVFIYKA